MLSVLQATALDVAATQGSTASRARRRSISAITERLADGPKA
jgi:hypothetical protein